MKPGIGVHDGLIGTPDLFQSVLISYSPSSLENLPIVHFNTTLPDTTHPPSGRPSSGGEMTVKALGPCFIETLEIFYTSCQEQACRLENPPWKSVFQPAADTCFAEFSEKLTAVYL